MAEGAHVGVDEDEGYEEHEDQDVYGVDHADSADQVDPLFKPLDVPQNQVCNELDRDDDQHHDLVGYALHWVELFKRFYMMRAVLAAEDAVAVVAHLRKSLVKEFPRIELRVIHLDLS